MIINDKEIEINRKTARVTTWDKVYCQILKDIISNGEYCENRTGIDTLSIEGVDFKLDVEKEFPILETKKVFMENSIVELLWIYQAQSNDVKWLHDRNCPIWDEWMIDADGIYRTYEPFLTDDLKKVVNVKDIYGKDTDLLATSLKEDRQIKSAKYFGKEFAGTIGTAYGEVLRQTGEFDHVLDSLKNNPRDRRMNISLKQANLIRTGVLEPCVWASTYKLYNGKLNSNIDVRSNDMPIGNPFNVTQYAVLLSMLAKVADMKVGNLNWRISDCHIYVNQLKEIKLQLSRFDKLLKWEEYIKTHNDEDIEYTHFELINRRKMIEAKRTLSKKYEEDFADVYDMTCEEILTLEHLLTRTDPFLYLADKDDFYDFDNKKKNDDIKIKNYKSLPAIKMPVAQ